MSLTLGSFPLQSELAHSIFESQSLTVSSSIFLGGTKGRLSTNIMQAIPSIRDIFAEQGLVDNREALFSFSIPGVEGEWGFFPPTAAPWKVLAVAVMIQSVIQCLFAVIIWYTIVQRRGTQEAYLIGWGIIVPISLYLPFYLLETFQLQNRVVNLAMSTVMTVLFFRVIEAMYGTSPPYVTKSLANYVGYFSSVVPYIWDPKTETRAKISASRLSANLLSVMGAFTLVSVILSFLKHYDYRPFPSTVKLDEVDLTWELLSPNHIANAYCHAWLIYGTLRTGFEGTTFGENIKGFDTHYIFDDPFFQSRSPTEFWTRRWNLLTHPLLKHGIFLPAKQYANGKVALFITFLVSGLYHDFVWHCIFYDVRDANGNCLNNVACYDHRFGRVTLFFAYVGLIMLLERPILKLGPVQWISKRLPTAVIAHALLLIHLPLGYWYYGDWIVGGYFEHFAIAVWQVKRIH